MKVRELIEALTGADPESEVSMKTNSGSMSYRLKGVFEGRYSKVIRLSDKSEPGSAYAYKVLAPKLTPAEIAKRDNTWRTSAGNTIKVSDMNRDHLVNAVNYFLGKDVDAERQQMIDNVVAEIKLRRIFAISDQESRDAAVKCYIVSKGGC